MNEEGQDEDEIPLAYLNPVGAAGLGIIIVYLHIKEKLKKWFGSDGGEYNTDVEITEDKLPEGYDEVDDLWD